MIRQPPREDEATSWMWAGLWMLFILVTVPLARSLQQFVYETAGRNTFLFVVLGAIALGLAAALRVLARNRDMLSPGRTLWLFGIAGLFTYLTFQLRAAPEEAFHFVQYGVLAILVFRAFSHRIRDPLIYVATAMLCGIAGMTDEFIQWIIPRRFFDFRDILINLTAAILMMTAFAGGLRPHYIRERPTRRSIHLTGMIITLQMLFWLFMVSNTPGLIAAYARLIPSVLSIDEPMVEYGYRVEDPEAGLVFFTRIAPDRLAGIDRQRAPDMIPVLEKYKSNNLYGAYLERFTSFGDPYMHEVRVHLFRRDRYAMQAIRSTDADMMRDNATVAYREHQILDRYFPAIYRRSSFYWAPDFTEQIRPAADLDTIYTSKVSASLFTRFTRSQLQGLTGGLLLLTLILWRQAWKHTESPA